MNGDEFDDTDQGDYGPDDGEGDGGEEYASEDDGNDGPPVEYPFDIDAQSDEVAPVEEDWHSPIMGDAEPIRVCSRRDHDGCPMLDVYEVASTRQQNGRVVPKVGAWVGRVRADADEAQIMAKHGKGAFFLQLRDTKGRVVKQRGLRLGRTPPSPPKGPRAIGAFPPTAGSADLVGELRGQIARLTRERDEALARVDALQAGHKQLEKQLVEQRIAHLEARLQDAVSGRGAPRSVVDELRGMAKQKRELEEVLGELGDMNQRMQTAQTPEEQQSLFALFAEQLGRLKDVQQGLGALGPILGLD